MPETINQIQQNDDHHQERSRLVNVLAHSQELINNLNLKIDRRINSGYYYQVAAKRRTLAYPAKSKSKPKDAKSKKSHPVVKKVKKPNDEKVVMVDQEQNTDQVQFCQKDQNTSGVYVLKEPETVVEDEQMQWSCEVTEIEQRNQSMQWSIEPIQQFNEEFQYTLESELVFVQCRDASIQYTLQSQPQPQPQPIRQPIPKPLPQPEPEPQKAKIVYEDAEIQCEKTKNEQISVQYNEPLPETKQKNMQINLPDVKQLSKIASMENRMKYLKLSQRKQQKLQKKKEQEIEILKLKQIMQKLEGKIELAQEKQLYFKQQIENQLLLKEKQKVYQRQKLKIKSDLEKQYNSKLQNLVSKIKQGNKRPIVNNSYKQQEEKRLAELRRQEQQSKQELQVYRKEVDELKIQLKNEMFKRLSYENESDEDTATEQGQRLRNSSQLLSLSRRKQNNDVSMDNLFPNVRNRYAGAIVKNLPQDSKSYEQKKLNEHQEKIKQSKAYWRSKSPFDYEYEQLNTSRIDRKYSYLQKLSQKKLQEFDKIQNHNPQQSVQSYSPLKSRARFDSKYLTQRSKTFKLKYMSKKLSFSWKELKQIRNDFDDLYGNAQLFRYLYSQEDKINLGLKLFDILRVKIDSKVENPITIYKYQNYIVFEYRQEVGLQFILFYHQVKSAISGKLPHQNTNYQFYERATNYKNGQIFEYLSQNELFNGFYSQGQRQGFGILSNSSFHYEGNFSQGRKEGTGKLVLQNGDNYKGEFKGNHFHGEGIYTWTNQQKYDGFFSQGLKHGFGKHYFSNGDIYEGQYKNNKRDGKGIYRWKDGSTYEGGFLNDQKCGEGKLVASNGSVVVGEWRADEIIELASKKYSRVGRSREDLPLASKIKGGIEKYD